eukprot:COSAG04_NODE_11110_length_729_cov_1.028526_3_plen_111_part_01
MGGVGLALLRVADFCGDEAAAAAAGIPPADAAALRADCLQKARRAAQVCLAGQPPNAQYGVSFFLGTPGHLALAAVVAHRRVTLQPSRSTSASSWREAGSTRRSRTRTTSC